MKALQHEIGQSRSVSKRCTNWPATPDWFHGLIPAAVTGVWARSAASGGGTRAAREQSRVSKQRTSLLRTTEGAGLAAARTATRSGLAS